MVMRIHSANRSWGIRREVVSPVGTQFSNRADPRRVLPGAFGPRMRLLFRVGAATIAGDLSNERRTRTRPARLRLLPVSGSAGCGSSIGVEGASGVHRPDVVTQSIITSGINRRSKVNP